jgi:hypothetical protein
MDNEHTITFRIRWNPDRPLTDSELNEYRLGSSFEQKQLNSYFPKRTLENDFRIDRELQRSWNFTGISGNPAQDQAVTCGMGPITDRSQEHLGSSDTAIIALRRRLLQAVRGFQEGKGPDAAYHGEVYKVRPGDVMWKKDKPFDDEITQLLAAKI